jgi:hypothetical protein
MDNGWQISRDEKQADFSDLFCEGWMAGDVSRGRSDNRLGEWIRVVWRIVKQELCFESISS